MEQGAIEICKKFDKNGDGYISKDELRQATGNTMSAKEINDLIKKADVDKDGKVNYEGNWFVCMYIKVTISVFFRIFQVCFCKMKLNNT